MMQSNMSHVITDALPEHIPEIEKLESLCFSAPRTASALKSQLTGDRYVFLAAVDGGSVLGYAGFMYVLDEGYIINVAVRPNRRRSGVGGALITALLHRARALNLSFLTLELRASNAPARRLYEKHGFAEVGVRKNYYEKPAEDAMLMTLLLK